MKLLPVVLALALSAGADPRTITVSGNGHAAAEPDRVSFTVGVSTRRPTVGEAFRENNASTARLVAALKAKGATDGEIQTSNFMIEQPYEAGRVVANQYVVRNSVTVTRHDLKNVSELLQAAIDAGANQAFGLHFFIADPSPLRDRALEAAFRDARARAEKLAAVAGRSLGETLEVTTERPISPFAGSLVGGVVGGVEGGPPMEPGVTTMNVTLYVTFELK